MNDRRRGFTLLELVVVLAILSALTLSSVLILSPQLAYFRIRSATLRLEFALRDQQAQAARAGFSSGGARGGGVMLFRGRVRWDREATQWQVEDQEEPDAYSYLVCPVDYTTDPDRPSVQMPTATALSGLTQLEMAQVVNFPEARLYRDASATAAVASGDYILFAERDLRSTDSGPGPKPLDRGSAIFSPGLDTDGLIVVRGPDDDPAYTIVVDRGGFVFARTG